MNSLKRNKLNARYLRLSLKYRPEILKLILRMKICIKKKKKVISGLKHNLEQLKNVLEKNAPQTQTDKMQRKDVSSQTDTVSLDNVTCKDENKDLKIAKDQEEKEVVAWSVNNKGEEEKSIADQVKEVAQSALKESGMVYVESAGMYYDYKTGYYYNPELSLYYHTDTDCYYYYSEEKKNFVFHSYPDRKTALPHHANTLIQRKIKKHKLRKNENEIETLTKNLSQATEDKNQDGKSKPKRKKAGKVKENAKQKKLNNDDIKKDQIDPKFENNEHDKIDKVEENAMDVDVEENMIDNKVVDLEDGECSETDEEKDSDKESDEESDSSTSTATDDETVARHHPPCMRVIVSETGVSKLRVGSLFLVTKDGGTVGREGAQHAIVIGDHNVSRTHLDIKYDMHRGIYTMTDLGSKNGTVLNGARMSPSLMVSEPMEVVHGSMVQLGETKLLCHIHPGTNTCGHCEPGLIMEASEKEKTVAYTRTCSVQRQHQLELARLRNKYAPQPPMIEDGAYVDRAKQRRDAVGSSHAAEKTHTSDLDTFIAPENKGFKLLEKMGWSKGEGLGKDCQGEVEPVPLVTNDGKAGLGTAGASGPPAPSAPVYTKKNSLGPATLRLATRTKMLQPPAKAFQDPLEDDSE